MNLLRVLAHHFATFAQQTSHLIIIILMEQKQVGIILIMIDGLGDHSHAQGGKYKTPL
jgi:hypothetical protein